MPTVRKIEAPDTPPSPDLPDDLAGWAWEHEPNGEQMRLRNPERTWSTKWYLKNLDRAISEARRWLLSQPKPKDEGSDSSFVVRPLSADDEGPLITLAELDQLAAWQPGPDASGVFRRPPGMAERVLVDPRNLLDGRWQPRTSMDEAKLQELTDSIREHGILEDLIALVNEAGQLELVAGHRRKTAAIRADLQYLPVKIIEVSASQARALALISNIQREDLTDVERGQAYEAIIREEGISEADLARRLSRPRAYIQQRRAIAGAAPEIASALAAGTLSFTQARGICAGAPGHHLAQLEALKSLRSRGSWQGPATEADAQKYAEEAVLSTAKQTLQALGWKVERFYAGEKTLTVVYSDRDRPKAWTSAEILAALREQRRPSESGEIPPAMAVADADWKAIKRRGWEVSDRQFAPWVLAKAPKVRFLRADEVAALVEQARTDLEALKARYAAQGWSLTLRKGSTGDDFDAKTKEGREEHCYSWTMATRLIKRIEEGKESREPNRTMHQCARCKETKLVGWAGGYYCQECIEAMRTEEQRIRAELRQEVAQLAGEWIAAAPDRVLRLLATESESDELHTQRHMPRGERAHNLRVADPAALQKALLDDLIDLAYAWRDEDLGGHAVAGERAVGAEGGTE